MAGRLLYELVSKSNQEGSAYLGKGDLIRAEIFFTISARAFEKGIHSYYNLALIQARQNKTRKAIELLKIVIENGRSRGVTDFSWLIKPEELEPLQGLPEFSEIMKQIGLDASD
jgi:hypothetical protein